MSDPLCPEKMHGWGETECLCDLLAEVRSEERKRAAKIVYDTRGVWRDPDMAWTLIEAIRGET